MRKLVHLLISGNVQGVGYRAFVGLQAERFDLDGWVRNRRDGTVEAVAAGDPQQIEKLIDACRKGPPVSRVTSVEVTDANEDMLALRPSDEKFTMLPTL